MRQARKGLPWAALGALLLYQSWAFWYRLPLSLGPVVILNTWLMNRGFVLFEQAADLHNPLLLLILAALARLPWSELAAARGVLIALLSATTLLTFLAGRRWAGSWAGLGAAAYLVLWAPIYSRKLWFESLLAPLYLLLALVYDPAARERPAWRIWLTGLIGGAALLTKQHALIVLFVIAAWHLIAGWGRARPLGTLARELGWMAGGAALPILAFALYQYLQAGTLAGFIYWTVTYPMTSRYTELAYAVVGPPSADDLRALALHWLLLPAAPLVLADCLWRRAAGERAARLGWTLALLAAASVTVYPLFFMFHLQAAAPFAVLATVQAAAVAWTGGGWRRALTLAATAGAALAWLAGGLPGHAPVLERDAPRAILQYSELQPFARRIREHIGPEACIYLLPDVETTANLYYHLRCEPPRYWTFHYTWYMAEDPIRNAAYAALVEAEPEWVVYFPEWWHTEQYAPEIVEYVRANYQHEADVQWDWRSAQLWRRVR